MIAGDGKAWKVANGRDTSGLIEVGFAFGEFWGYEDASNSPNIWTGYEPDDLRDPRQLYRGLNAPVRWIHENSEQEILAVARVAPGSGQFGLFVWNFDTESWQQANPPFTVLGWLKFQSVGGRWFTTGNSTTTMYTSEDGLSWSASSINKHSAALTEHMAQTVVMYKSGSSSNATLKVAKLSGANTWNHLAVSGLPDGGDMTGGKLFSVNGSLVAFIKNSGLYYSNDGVTWVKSLFPSSVVGAAMGAGQLVVALENGGVLQTGTTHAGINAPTVAIHTPVNDSGYMIGSDVAVQGLVRDPEQGAVDYECYVDGILVKTGFGDSFSFEFVANNLKGHHIRVVGIDSYGLRQSEAIRVTASVPQPINQLETNEGELYLPAVSFATEINGVFYVLGTNGLYRSTNGEIWERVYLPSYNGTMLGLSSINGGLVIQLGGGDGFLSTRDGINWSRSMTSPEFESFSETGNTRQSSQYGTIHNVVKNSDGVLLGLSSTRREVYASFDSGESWSLVDSIPTSFSFTYFTSILYAKDRFRLLDGVSNSIKSSADGVTWISNDIPNLATFGNDSKEFHLYGAKFFLGKRRKS